MLENKHQVQIHVLSGFDDPVLNDESWSSLKKASQTDTVFLTRGWLQTWWRTFGRGRLILLAVFRGRDLVGLAPLFADEGMIFFVGSGGSDYLDFIGELSEPEILADLLGAAKEQVPDFVGFRFYHVPDSSRTGSLLQIAAATLGLKCFDEGHLSSPAVDLRITGDAVTRKKSLVRHQRYFEREGDLVVRHFTESGDITPRLDSFFDQHVGRWADTPYPSLFLDPLQREFYTALVKHDPPDGWLRFSEVTWNDRPIAYHFGFSYQCIYMWYKPSFAIELAKRSPGEVLIRNLLMVAISEGADIFDLGIGDEPFKERFATHTRTVRTWGLYAPEALSEKR